MSLDRIGGPICPLAAAEHRAKTSFAPKPIKSEPFDQSTCASGSIFLDLVRTYNKKESARFGLERPVDALFRISLKTPPTPNDAKPRPHIRIAAAQGGYLHRVKVSIGLVAPFAR